MAGPTLPDAGIVMENGVIIDVGPRRALAARQPDAQAVDAGDSVLLPGLINAHAHLELSTFSAEGRPRRFVDWILSGPRLDDSPGGAAGQVARGTALAIDQCLRFGICAVGDISWRPDLTRPLLSQSPLRITSFGEVTGMAARRSHVSGRLEMALDRAHETPGLTVGVSPHAPYSIELGGYRACVDIARAMRRPVATHLAETPDEALFLARHEGPFRELWNALGAWTDDVPRFEGGPIRFARAAGLLDQPALLAHVNYIDDEELAILAQGRASVVYCPRTHAYFRHPPHRFERMLALGVNVAVGTDSCASSPDLNLVDDLRLIHRQCPNLPVETIWSLATTRSAAALGYADGGRLATGRRADVAVFPARGPSPLLDILESTSSPKQVWIAGKRMIGAS